MKIPIILVLLFSLGATTAYGHEGHSEAQEETVPQQEGLQELKKDQQKYLSKIKEIKLEARQYRFSPDPVVVRKGDVVRLKVTSRDVTHGMYIKEYGINLTVKKGEVTEVEFLADKAGKFDILCSVYCGRGHSEMKGTLLVEEK